MVQNSQVLCYDPVSLCVSMSVCVCLCVHVYCVHVCCVCVCICLSVCDSNCPHVIVSNRHRGAVDTAFRACNVLFSCHQHSNSLLGITSLVASTVLMWSPAIGVPTLPKATLFLFPQLCTTLQIIFLFCSISVSYLV